MKKLLVGTGILLAAGLGVGIYPRPEGPKETASIPEAVPAARAPASSPAQLPALPAAKASPAQLVNRITELSSCYGNENCAYPKTDARSYEFALGQDMKGAILALAEEAKSHDLRSDDLARLGRHQLANADGHVQEAALALLATQNPSDDTLNAVLEHVIGGYDAQLMQAAFAELRRYDSDAQHERIAAALSNAMVSGSPFVAKEVAASIRPFLYPRSIALYEEAMGSLMSGSAIRADLGKSLAAFRAGI